MAIDIGQDAVEALVINPNGTKATVSHIVTDSDFYITSHWVYLKFADERLNPPGNESWECGTFEADWRQDNTAKVMEVAQRFYDYLMWLHAPNDHRIEIDNTIRQRDEARAERNAIQVELINAKKHIETLHARIEALETDEFQQLTAENGELRNAIRNATSTLGDALARYAHRKLVSR